MRFEMAMTKKLNLRMMYFDNPAAKRLHHKREKKILNMIVFYDKTLFTEYE